MRYPIIIERGSNSFSAYAPDFPGCIAAAETERETMQLMSEALQLHIEDMRQRGEAMPDPSAAREIDISLSAD